MADQKIPGIYNYCDRWCERCPFSNRCSVFGGDLKESAEENDIRNKAFWNRLAINFTKAHQLIEEKANEQGVSLNTLAQEIDDHELQEKRSWEESHSHPLGKLSLSYGVLAKRWLKDQPGMICTLEQLQENLKLGKVSVQEAKAVTETISDCLAVIEWYETLIHVKLMRALMGKRANEPEEDEVQRDYDGSAKIGILGIERSMQAWVKLYGLLPEQEDDFLQILALLEKMKVTAESEFPKARNFRRPGFDD